MQQNEVGFWANIALQTGEVRDVTYAENRQQAEESLSEKLPLELAMQYVVKRVSVQPIELGYIGAIGDDTYEHAAQIVEDGKKSMQIKDLDIRDMVHKALDNRAKLIREQKSRAEKKKAPQAVVFGLSVD